MQVVIELPDKIAKDLKHLYKNKKDQERVLREAVRERIKRIKQFRNDPFVKWLMNEKNTFKGPRDASKNHDKYLADGEIATWE